MCRRSCRPAPISSRPVRTRKADAADAHSVALVGTWVPDCGRWSATSSGVSVYFNQSAYREVQVERRCAT